MASHSDVIFICFFSYRYWEGIVALRKVAIALIGVFGNDLQEMQVQVTLMLLIVVMLLTLHIRPFASNKHESLLLLEMSSLVATFFSLWAGTVFFMYPKCEDPLRKGFTLWWCDTISVFAGLTIIGVLIAIIVCFASYKMLEIKTDNVSKHPEDSDGTKSGEIEMKRWHQINPMLESVP